MYYVYILKNQDGGYYVGSCGNLEVRLKRHNQNSVRSTKHKGPFTIVYKAGFKTITEARKKENEIKKHKDINRFLKTATGSLSPSSSLV
ncbi:MAG: GIY-YIG nuclease family protein [Candidatus Omnitrophota bacterium]|nr:GIY-YIG nuclease family protein [Candidatus Omnitrophota bacterium]